MLLFAAAVVPVAEISSLQKTNFIWLGVSGATTALSWVFYYKALKIGDVATVALIDKGSVVIAMLLAWLILKESITPRLIMGASFIVAGLFIIAKK